MGPGIPVIHVQSELKRGLIIGKFLPLHAGHIALIRFAAARCDEVIVSMSFTRNDPIDAGLRFSWIKETFLAETRVHSVMVPDNFDDETLPMEERVLIWAAFARGRFPRIDFIFSSESYGDLFAGALGASHIAFDINRNRYPVSATLIRKNPFSCWAFIPDAVRPYFVKKICFYGPESTGKTTLIRHLADLYETSYVPEVAREFIVSNQFSLEDIVRTGHAQTRRVIEMTASANRILFCDTDVITTEIYSRYYLHEVPPILSELEQQVKYDVYFLFDIDVPWVADGVRDLGGKREVLYDLFRSALEKRRIPFIPVSGSFEERERTVRGVIDRWLAT